MKSYFRVVQENVETAEIYWLLMLQLSLYQTDDKHMNVNTQTLFQLEEVATGSSAASAILLAAMTSRMDISKYLRFTT